MSWYNSGQYPRIFDIKVKAFSFDLNILLHPPYFTVYIFGCPFSLLDLDRLFFLLFPLLITVNFKNKGKGIIWNILRICRYILPLCLRHPCREHPEGVRRTPPNYTFSGTFSPTFSVIIPCRVYPFSHPVEKISVVFGSKFPPLEPCNLPLIYPRYWPC